MNPSAPVATNAARQPQVTAIHGTAMGAMIAPTLLPALNTPTASALSFFGNHSATVFNDAGKLADSPRPSSARIIPNAPTVVARAVAIAATLHTTIAAENPVRTPMRSSS